MKNIVSLASMVAFFAPIAIGVGSASAQFPYTGPGTVSGTGVSQIERLPEVIRMRVVITAKGSTLEEALAALKDKTDAARGQLATLGSDAKSAKLDGPQIAAGKTDRQRQIEMMMAQRLRGGARRTKTKEEAKTPIAVSATLTAEWPLKAESSEALLVAATTLQEKIKAADLAGAKEASQLTPEEQEALEEMEAQGFDPYGGEEAKPGEPVFYFVSAISDADREKVEAEAFQKAKQNAARLAKAAGAKLGKLTSLAGNAQPGGVSDDYSNMYGGYAAAQAYRMMQSLTSGAEDDAPAEAIGATPGKVSYRVTMNASFELTAP